MRHLFLALMILPSCLMAQTDSVNKTIGESQKMAEKMLFTQSEQAFLEKAARINKRLKQRIAEDKTKQDSFVEQIPDKQIITLAEAVEKYGIERNFNHEDELILVFKGDLSILRWDDDWLNTQLKTLKWKGSLNGFVVTGNLNIKGDMIDGSTYAYVRVLKNLYCDYLFSRDGHISVRGNADVRYGIYGEYNDGSFNVDGNLNTPYIIADDHDMPRSAASESIYMEAGEGSERGNVFIGSEYTGTMGWGWEYFENADRFMSPEVWNENRFSVSKFMHLVRQGDNPFLDN